MGLLAIKVTPNQGVTLIDLLCKFTIKDAISILKTNFKKFQKKNINVLATYQLQECRKLATSLTNQMLLSNLVQLANSNNSYFRISKDLSQPSNQLDISSSLKKMPTCLKKVTNFQQHKGLVTQLQLRERKMLANSPLTASQLNCYLASAEAKTFRQCTQQLTTPNICLFQKHRIRS